MRQRESIGDGGRCKQIRPSNESSMGHHSPSQETTNKSKSEVDDEELDTEIAHEDAPPDDNASDSSDLISFTMLEMDNSSPQPTHQLEMPVSPISAGVDSEDDFLSAFPIYDDPMACSSFATSQRSPAADVTSLQNQLQNLRATIRALRTEKQIAEERAHRTVERFTEMKELLQQQQVAQEKGTTGKAASNVEGLHEQNRLLKEQLNDAQSHIFSLQPYRKELTPEEIGREFDEMIEQVRDWVEKVMAPYLDDHERGVHQILSSAKRQTAEAMSFKRSLQAHPDLVNACIIPETDEDIIVALILRYLHDNIFQKILYGALDHYTVVLSLVETHMQMSVEPRRDLFSVRNWTAEAYNALLSAPPFRKIRDRTQRRLTMELAYKLKVLCKKADWDAFNQSLGEACVQPAMRLYEKMQISTHHFYLDVNPMMVHCRDDGSLVTSPEFYDSLGSLDCRNVLQHRKAFSVGKLDPALSLAELHHRLQNVCTVTPALYMRRVGRRDAIKEPEIVRRQQTLVAWGTEEMRRAFFERGERTILAHLYFSKERSYPWS